MITSPMAPPFPAALPAGKRSLAKTAFVIRHKRKINKNG